MLRAWPRATHGPCPPFARAEGAYSICSPSEDSGCLSFRMSSPETELRFSESSEALTHAHVAQPLPQLQLAAGPLVVRDRITCLSVCLDQCGSTHRMVGHSLEAATKVWAIFCAPSGPSAPVNAQDIVVSSAPWGGIVGKNEMGVRRALFCRAALDTMGWRMLENI